MKARVTGYKKVAGLLDDEIAKKPKRSARYEIDIPDMAGGACSVNEVDIYRLV